MEKFVGQAEQRAGVQVSLAELHRLQSGGEGFVDQRSERAAGGLPAVSDEVEPKANAGHPENV
jgi:hypothetical protein